MTDPKRRAPQRKPIELPPTPPPSAGWAALFDLLTFRAAGFALLYNEAVLQKDSDKWLIGAAICMFFMPDWIRGRDNPLLATVRAWLTRGSRGNE